MFLSAPPFRVAHSGWLPKRSFSSPFSLRLMRCFFCFLFLLLCRHVSRQKCLCVFQHADFVTAVAWHPVEDRYFVSGSFDKKLRIWNIPEHRVVEWAQTSNIITAATFNPNGNMTVAGLYNGSAIFYQTDGLKSEQQIDCIRALRWRILCTPRFAAFPRSRFLCLCLCLFFLSFFSRCSDTSLKSTRRIVTVAIAKARK